MSASTSLPDTARAFMAMAHRIVWATVASVDRQGRPRSRIMHPIWTWQHETLTGWIATRPTPLKQHHLAADPYVSINYWAPTHDTCTAECRAELLTDDATRTIVWDLFASGPEPVGYDPRIVPGWESPTAPAFAVLRLSPWRLRVFPGTVLLGQGGNVLTWRTP
jgi:general stress protein 26